MSDLVIGFDEIVEPMSPAQRSSVRVLAVADTDSYLKWSVATLATLPSQWSGEQIVIDNPVRPSGAQMMANGTQEFPVLRRRGLLNKIESERPDVVFLACTGPVVATLTESKIFRSPDRPVLITGLPGISIPASSRAVESRAGCDLFVVHSHREQSEFATLATDLAPHLTLGLATLPFLSPKPNPERATGSAELPGPLIFAAQSHVPLTRADRHDVLLALADAGGAMVKLRALANERQTHHETLPYPSLFSDLARSGRCEPGSVSFTGGSMQKALSRARALATVSSTAALEAIAMDLPTLIISDFGVSDAMINTVFVGSGVIGSLDDLRGGRINRADPSWMRDNYFHPPADNDWLEQLERLLSNRTLGELPHPSVPGSRAVRIRRRARLVAPRLTRGLGGLRRRIRHRG